MKPSYKTLKPASFETVIKKSRFLSSVYPIKSEDEAQQILSSLRAKYSDATHVCYAYVLAIDGNIERFSDDGEPSGTAGMPILDVIKNSQISEILVAVVRYFGGTKLGAGGLVRAYSESAKGCIAIAEPVEYVFCDIYDVSLSFSELKKINQLLSNIVCKTLKISYNEVGAMITLAVRADIPFLDKLRDFLLGREAAQKIDSDYIELSQ